MEKKDINFLFNEVPLYTKETFEVLKLEDNIYFYQEQEFSYFLSYIGINQDKLVTYCHLCKKEFPFNISKRLFEFLYDFESEEENIQITELRNGNARLNLTTGMLWGMQPPYEKDCVINNKIWYIEYFFTCAHDDTHKYLLIISVELKDGKFIVRKIGQNPSMLTVKGFDFDKYKNILEKFNAYEDYKKADLSNAEHFHVGAYAYLRRIFEKMVNYFLNGIKLEDNHMETKINAVKDKFDPRINGLLKNLYGILSKGIHELDEDQSKEYYSYLKAIIDMQLEFMKTEEDKEKQTKENEKIISKIANLIK